MEEVFVIDTHALLVWHDERGIYLSIKTEANCKDYFWEMTFVFDEQIVACP